ncbi:MAG: aspartate-semialdehyde dehydrogenase [Clostridia bacterium]|nr:aspartate-semialdehyde dehydrogenase [Clostridia bacterium]
MKEYNIAVVGATGMVGRKFLQVLEERKLPAASYRLLASRRSAGREVEFMGRTYEIEELNEHSFDDGRTDIALFSAGAGVSSRFAPIAAENGALVIDNSSAWRMHEDVPLVVPEVNPQDIAEHKGIIANPNCSTIQAVVALKPLHDRYGIERVVYSTYQAVSGAGMGGYRDLENGISGDPPEKFPYPIFGNILPQIDVFDEDGYTKEELKMINETRKILGDPGMRITATTARVPVYYGHSESVNAELKKPFELDELVQLLRSAPGLVVQDETESGSAAGTYPMPLTAAGRDEVFVGRIRRDRSVPNGVNLWVVADNIRKGAATNAVQIAEEWIKMQSGDRA